MMIGFYLVPFILFLFSMGLFGFVLLFNIGVFWVWVCLGSFPLVVVLTLRPVPSVPQFHPIFCWLVLLLGSMLFTWMVGCVCWLLVV